MTDTKALVILGNGFDVAWGIPTRYYQFYKNSSELKKYAAEGNRLCKHILNNKQGELWSDLEEGLYEYSLAITDKYGKNNVEQAKILNNEYRELKSALFSYLNSVANTQVDIEEFQNVMGLNVEWINLDAQYLTFNYSSNTASCIDRNKRIILNSDDSINENVFIYQHGAIFDTKHGQTNSPEDIVLGIDSNCQKIEAAHSFLYKSNQRLHDIDDTLSIISSKDFYVIYGCSVGDSDAIYFKQVFDDNQINKTFLIYGFGEESLDSIKKNISKFCNFDKLCSQNHVVFLNSKDSINTREITRAEIQEYIQSL